MIPVPATRQELRDIANCRNRHCIFGSFRDPLTTHSATAHCCSLSSVECGLTGDVGALPVELKRGSALSASSGMGGDAADPTSAASQLAAADGVGLGHSGGDVLSISSLLGGRAGAGEADSPAALQASDALSASRSGGAGTALAGEVFPDPGADGLAGRGGAVSSKTASDTAGAWGAVMRDRQAAAVKAAGGTGTGAAREEDHSTAGPGAGLRREQLPLATGTEHVLDPGAAQRELVPGSLSAGRGSNAQASGGDRYSADASGDSVTDGAAEASAVGRSSAAGRGQGSTAAVTDAASTTGGSAAARRQGDNRTGADAITDAAVRVGNNDRAATQRAAADESRAAVRDGVGRTADLQNQHASVLGSAGDGGGGQALIEAGKDVDAAVYDSQGGVRKGVGGRLGGQSDAYDVQKDDASSNSIA